MRATALVPGATSARAGGDVLVAGQKVGTIIGGTLVDGGLEVELELDPTRVEWLRTTIPPGSISYKEG